MCGDFMYAKTDFEISMEVSIRLCGGSTSCMYVKVECNKYLYESFHQVIVVMHNMGCGHLKSVKRSG
jgi:hypothetical protein